MTKRRTALVAESAARPADSCDERAAATLAAAIREPLDVLDAAAEEAANGMLGRAKLGLLVAASRLIHALKAVDAEFARRHASGAAGRPEVPVER